MSEYTPFSWNSIVALAPFAARYARILEENDRPLKVLVPFAWLKAAADALAEIDGVDDIRGEENALLLKAAPDLLAACEMVMAYRKGQGQFNFIDILDPVARANAIQDAWDEVERVVETAIAKATGND